MAWVSLSDLFTLDISRPLLLLHAALHSSACLTLPNPSGGLDLQIAWVLITALASRWKVCHGRGHKLFVKKVKVSAKNRHVKNRRPALLILSSGWFWLTCRKRSIRHSHSLLILCSFISFQGLIDDWGSGFDCITVRYKVDLGVCLLSSASSSCKGLRSSNTLGPFFFYGCFSCAGGRGGYWSLTLSAV